MAINEIITPSWLRERVTALRPTRDEIIKRWDYYRNDVARRPYFPYLRNETPEQYKRRFKIGVGWIGSLSNRVAAYFRKGPILVEFAVEGNPDNSIAKLAADLWAEMAEQNGWDTFMIDVARDAGVGGNGYVKDRFRFYDPQNGHELRTGKFKGQIRFERASEAYVYQIFFARYRMYVEAWQRAGNAYGFIGEEQIAEGAEKLEYLEAVLPNYHSIIDGKREQEGIWRIWENGNDLYNEGINFEGLPIHRFANLVSRPESENGISDIEWIIPLAEAVNHIVSGMVRTAIYHGSPKPVFEGVDPDTALDWRTEKALALPPNPGGERPKAGFLTWDQNLDGTMGITNRLTDFISAISGVPKHLLHELEGAGSIPSGAALRILYTNLNEVCRLKEAGFQSAEEEMIKSALSQLAFWNNNAGLFRNLQVKVTYNPDRTPRDADLELERDLKLLSVNYLNLVDIVMRNEPGINSREEALQLLIARATEKEQLRAAGVIGQLPDFSSGEEDPDEPAGDKKGENKSDETD